MKGMQRLWTILVGQTRTTNLRSLPVLLKKVILFLIVAHFLNEVSSIITEIWPKGSRREVSFFLKPGFEAPMPLNWWIKYLSDDVFNVITYYCLGVIAKHVGNILFLICFIFLTYHVVDLLMYFWDFKTSHYFYFDLFYTSIVFIKLAIGGYKPETIAKIKSLF
jgi:hypothetical protein